MRSRSLADWELRPKRGGTLSNSAFAVTWRRGIVHAVPGFSLLFYMRVCVVLKRAEKIKRLSHLPTSLKGVTAKSGMKFFFKFS